MNETKKDRFTLLSEKLIKCHLGFIAFGRLVIFLS